jgi:hypothetical protein
MKKPLLIAALGVALFGGVAQAQTPAPAAEKPAGSLNLPVVEYAGGSWEIDPKLGAVQGVITEKRITAGGVGLRGVVFIHDDGGWRAAGTFVESSPDAKLRDANVNAELRFVIVGN